MTTVQDYKQRLVNAWRGDPDDPQEREIVPDGGVVRRPLQLMDSRPKAAWANPNTPTPVVDQSLGRSVLRTGSAVYMTYTDAERENLEDLRLAHKRKLSRMWKRYHNSARTDVETAEREAKASADYASVPPAPPVTSNAQAIGPQPLSDAGKAAMAKYHQRLEGAWKQEPVQ